MARKRVAMTLDEDIYAQFQSTVIEQGYPRAAVGMIVQNFMKKVIRDIEKNGVSVDLVRFDLGDEIGEDETLVVLADKK
ncbi:hypothetical protein HTZ97_13715 [Desulfuromonas acetoxidans]|nr:hypothetical protein [Desulfuromonas acetoxidans]MBF0644872.1 hypothetical protein [Desulfuromonas acetoxidans]NVD25389.1 hypothetical protein [Desulfuromonas acetoxidans]NVE17510.1 hypothetical protein [Desulfuromonas acetoxidans]